VLLWCSAPTSAQAQTAEQAAEASEHFDRGYELAQQGSLEEAIGEFKRAYALSPHPSVLYNLGQAYAASGRAAEAVRTLREYLEKSDPQTDPEKRDQASSLIEYQSQRVGFLDLTVTPAGATLTLDGESLGTAPLAGPLELTAGVHVLEVTYPGYASKSFRVELVGKSRTNLELGLDRVPPAATADAAPACADPNESARRLAVQVHQERARQQRVHHTAALVTGIAGAVSLVGGGVVFWINQRDYAEWHEDSRALGTRLQQDPGSVSAAELDELLQRENSLRNRDALSLGLAVAGAALGISSAALWLTAPDTDTPVQIRARLGQSLTLEGTF
jgi:hypothetical protein